MKTLKLIFTFILSFFIINLAQAQSEEGIEASDSKFEIIVSGIYAYSPSEEEGIEDLEFHFTYWFNESYGTGLSYSIKFAEEETLHDIAPLFSIAPKPWFTFNVGPSFAIPTEERDFAVSAYLETEINIRPIENFHFGPVFGTILGKHTEVSAGFHVGFEF